MSRPRKPGDRKLEQFSIRLIAEDKDRLEDAAILFGSSSKAFEQAVRALYSSLTATQLQAIAAVKSARNAMPMCSRDEGQP